MLKKIVIFLMFVGVPYLFAADGKAIANKLGVSASSKAAAQWERAAEKDREPFAGLSAEDKKALLDYLVKHAADSNTPEAAGM
ncbi:MAG: hypothetical protein RBR23_06945 [Arcobacteraceae bacterium]|jgi:hypothetical protein|nr:hypothetical protein [Arcobacteraceae bacterium]